MLFLKQEKTIKYYKEYRRKEEKKEYLLTQQNDEKHIPMYNHGTRTPDISQLSYESSDPGSLGKLFKFQPDLMYFSSEPDTCQRSFGNPLPNVPVSKSAP